MSLAFFIMWDKRAIGAWGGCWRTMIDVRAGGHGESEGTISGVRAGGAMVRARMIPKRIMVGG